MGQYGFLKTVSICSFYANLLIIVDNFDLSTLSLKSILNLTQYNSRIKNKNRNDSIMNQKVNINTFVKRHLWISLLDKL